MGNELLCALPVFGDYTAVFNAGFIVKDLVFNDVAALLEPGHDTGVVGDAVAVVLGLKRFDEDDIGVAVASEQCGSRPCRL